MNDDGKFKRSVQNPPRWFVAFFMSDMIKLYQKCKFIWYLFFESNWIIDLSNTSTCTTCFSSQLNVVPRRFIIKIKLQSKLRTKYFHLDHMTNFGICNLCFYLMVFVGLFVVKGEGRICVTESRYWTRDK